MRRGWAVCYRHRGRWEPLLWTISDKRVQAIAQFDCNGDDAWDYAEERRAGRMKCIRVTITPEASR